MGASFTETPRGRAITRLRLKSRHVRCERESSPAGPRWRPRSTCGKAAAPRGVPGPFSKANVAASPSHRHRWCNISARPSRCSSTPITTHGGDSRRRKTSQLLLLLHYTKGGESQAHTVIKKWRKKKQRGRHRDVITLANVNEVRAVTAYDLVLPPLCPAVVSDLSRNGFESGSKPSDESRVYAHQE